MADKQIIMIAGPNGAGKTTFAMRHLQDEAGGFHFVNADLIASGISPINRGVGVEVAAGRTMLREIDRLAVQGRSFAFETTLSGRGLLRRISRWQQNGYRVTLIFLKLASVDDAISRVNERARQGGHTVPEAVIRRRFEAGLRNFRELYAASVDEWQVYDNTGSSPVLLEQGSNRG